MKRPLRQGLAAAVGLALTCAVFASPILASPCAAAQRAEDANAATHYAQAIERFRALPQSFREDLSWLMSDLELDCMPGGPGPSHEARQALNRVRPAISLAVSASRRSRCVFRIDRTDVASRGEFVADLRRLYWLINADVLARIEDQDARGATDLLVTLYRMTHHASGEGSLYGAIAAAAGVHRVDRLIDHALDHALIGPAEATRLLAEINRFDEQRPIDFIAAMNRERAAIDQTLAVRFEGDEGPDRFLQTMRTIGDAAPSGSASPASADGQELTADDLRAVFEHYSEIAAATATALAIDDENRRTLALKSIESRIESSPFNRYASYFVVVQPNVIANNAETVTKMISARRDVLANIASGTVEPIALANAAVFYARAARQARLIDPDKRRIIDGYAHRHQAEADFETATTLNRHDVQTLLRTLTQAATIDRCDWNANLPRFPYVHRWLHADLLWSGRLLVADAARMFHAQRYDDAARRIATGYSVAADLAAGGTVGDSLAAHRVFNDVDALAAAAIDSGMLNAEQIEVIATGVRQLARGDPFHYQPAMAALRRRVATEMMWFNAGLTEEPIEYTAKDHEEADALVADLDADRLMSIMIVYAYWERARWPQLRRPDPAVAAAGLNPILNVDAVRDAAAYAGVLTDWAKSNRMQEIRLFEFPAIAPVEERARQSLIDYRACVLRMDRLGGR